MSAQKKSGGKGCLVLAGLGLLGVAFFCCAGFLIAKFGDATVWVMAPLDEPVTFQVDGGEAVTLEPGEVSKQKMPKGSHVLTSDGDLNATVEVGGGLDYWVVLADDEACALRMDVTDAIYTHDWQEPEIPGVDRRYTEQVFEVPGGHYFDYESLPEEAKDGDKFWALVQVPCTFFEMPEEDQALLALLVFSGEALEGDTGLAEEDVPAEEDAEE